MDSVLTYLSSLSSINLIGFVAIFLTLIFLIVEFILYNREKKKKQLIALGAMVENPPGKKRGIKTAALVVFIMVMMGGIGLVSMQLSKPDPSLTSQQARAQYQIPPTRGPIPTLPPFVTVTPFVATPGAKVTPTGVITAITPLALPTSALLIPTQPVGGEIEATPTAFIAPEITIEPTTVPTSAPQPTTLLQAGFFSQHSLALFGTGVLIVFLSLIY